VKRRRPGGSAVGKAKSGKRSAHRARKQAGKEAAKPASRRIGGILTRLKREYPNAATALNHDNAYQLLVATILSAQCTDARVNLVTPEVFRRYPTAAALARARQGELEKLIQSTGFFRNKARNLIGMAQAVVADHAGEIPRSMEQLHALPGVGRKTANVVLGNAFGINEGITVDTHVARLSGLLRLTRHSDPAKIEQDLMALVPRDDWTIVSHLLILHGRSVCIARRPRCESCVLLELCPSARPLAPA
jgi:endonuclease-3